MPSKFPRVSVVMEPELHYAIEKLAKKDKVSLSQKTRDLLIEALELIEDAGLEAIVLERLKGNRGTISHAEMKRRFKIKT